MSNDELQAKKRRNQKMTRSVTLSERTARKSEKRAAEKRLNSAKTASGTADKKPLESGICDKVAPARIDLPSPLHSDRNNYEKRKKSAAFREAQASRAGRDIAPLPPVKKPARRAACELDLMRFLSTYFPAVFDLPWGLNHPPMIQKLETAVLQGGLFADAEPRGFGKTQIGLRAVIWATFYGHRKFVAIVGAAEDAAAEILQNIKTEIEFNDLLTADFPEICYPVRRLDGIANRCKGQLHNGDRTVMVWADDEIVLPTISGSAASGAVVKVRGITGRIRGMTAALTTGESIRPDFVFVDDPQTDESAASIQQNRARLKVLSGAILGLAGPGKKIAGYMPCTVIRPGDMADEILNRDRHPEWNGSRNKLMNSMPDNLELWDKYKEIWANSQRSDGTIAAATEFYREHREAMDAGAVCTWEARYLPGEISGIQHAMNIFARDPEVFYAEFQNEPLPEDLGDAEKIATECLRDRLNGRRRGEIPAAANRLAMFIDVQKNLLFYLLAAVSDDFTAWIVDYGAFPDQQRRYFTLRDARSTYPKRYPGAGLEGAVYAALREVTDGFLSREYRREDGVLLRIERCLIDSAWGKSTNVIYQLCRESPHAALLLPSRGKGITASERPIDEYTRKAGIRYGENWYIASSKGNRYIAYDTNAWKSFFRERLATYPGDPGSVTVFGRDFEDHRLLSEHLSSEFSTATAGKWRKVDIWKLLPGRENHWLDCLVGCYVAASERGVRLLKSRTADKSKRVSFAEMQKNRRQT